MPSVEPSSRLCPDCGLPLPSEREGAGCPNCLLRMAMGIEDEPPESETEESRIFGSFELLGELARGGMGVVYRAREISLDRVVALKMILPGHLRSPEAWQRFQTEIAATAQLNHPHIVPLYESGTVGGTQFFTMRFVEGGTLAAKLEHLRRGMALGSVRRSTREQQTEMVQLMILVARAVHYAHQRGVLHRDLKPSNILLDEEGKPHVADFGVAKLLEHDHAATRTESFLGSPNYMAPELADGRGKDVTVETDVYGVGTVLYETLTSSPPFLARTPVETIRQVLDEDPVPPRRLNPGIDSDLETICLKCLRKDPGERYESALELAADLERWCQRMPIVARPVGPVGAAVRWCRRHPALASVTSVLALTLFLVAVGASMAALRIGRAEQAVVAQLRESLLDNLRVLRASHLRDGKTDSRELLRKAATLGGDEDYQARLRNEALATLALPQVRFEGLPVRAAAGSLRILVDPTRKHIARIGADDQITLEFTAGTAAPRHIASAGTGSQLVSFSPDGRFLAVRHVEKFEIRDVKTSRSVVESANRSQVYAFATHVPLVALEEDGGAISLRELPSGRETGRITRTPDHPRNMTAMSFAPDGALLACGGAADKTIELVDVKSGKVRWRAGQTAKVVAFAWQLTRGRLLASLEDGRVLAVRLTSGEPVATVVASAPAHSLALSEGTGLLAGACRDRRIRIWDMVSFQLLFETEHAGQSLFFQEHDQDLCLGTVFQGDRFGWLVIKPSPFLKEAVIAAASMDLSECRYLGGGDIIGYGHQGRIGFVSADSLGLRGGMSVSGAPVFGVDPRGDFLLTADKSGISLHPLTRSESGAVLNHPAKRLVIPGANWNSVAISADGDHIWTADATTHLLQGHSRNFEANTDALGPHPSVNVVAVSPDGQFVASSSSLMLDAKVWDTQTRAVVVGLRAGRQQRLDFSGDGRWLAVHGDVFDLRSVGSWETVQLPYPGPRPMLGAAAFSADSRFLAVVENQTRIRVLDLENWRSMGLLDAPDLRALNAIAFSPDGSQLVSACAGGRLRVWDLKAIAREFHALGLTW